MKNKNTLYHSSMLVIGILLILLSFAGKVDAFWNGMGSALAIMGCIRLLRSYRLYKNEAYREKVEIELNDERNHFLRGKAWAWAGYLFIILAASAVILFKIAGQEVLSQAASWAVCLMLVLYWGAYHILKKKY